MTNTVTQELTDLIERIMSLPDTSLREFEEGMTDIITKYPDNIEANLTYILENEKEKELRFRAFFGLSIYQRRQKNHTEFKQLVEKYIMEFQEFDLHYHILSLMHKSFGDQEGIRKSIYYGKKAVEKLSAHVGVLHNFCEAVVTAQEEFLDPSPEYVEESILFIDTVLTLRPRYAKFYCTKGRILAQQKKFEEAKQNILKAIDLENNKTNDYTLRITDYKNTLSRIESLEQFHKIKELINVAVSQINEAENKIKAEVEGNKAQLEKLKTENLQMLAFFTGIISFIIGSITILSKQPTFLESAMLMMILAGTLVLCNVGFSILLLPPKENYTRYILVSLIGIFMILLSIFIHIGGM